MRRMNWSMAGGVLALFTFTSACVDGPAPPSGTTASEQPEPSGVTCTGKCDGFEVDVFKDYFDDMKDLSLEDLTSVGATFATGELNGLLGDLPYSEIRVSPTTLYGEPDEVFGQKTVHDLAKLQAGLTARLGANSFVTRVNALRRRHLADSEADVYAESHFRVGPTLSPNWGLDLGDRAVGRVGFNAGAAVEAVVIAPYEKRVDAFWKSPLRSLGSLRGFVLPRGLSDIRAMAPGETLALRADGGLGMNLGVGVPFYLGSIAEAVSVRARLSLAARVGLDGKLDVQLVRGDGHTAWLDVGLSRSSLKHFKVALSSGWGVEGIPRVDVSLGPFDVSVDELAEKALTKQLNERLNVSAEVSDTEEAHRISVARFKFDLTGLGSENDAARIEQALAQAMRGDIRLAQALANRQKTGVVQTLDFFKNMRREARQFGFHFLGMDFYRGDDRSTGTVHIARDGRHQQLLFSELKRKSGFFFTDRAASWRTLTSLSGRDGRLVDASVNASITMRESDSYLERDQLLDHLDPLLGYFTGYEHLFAGFGQTTDALAVFMDDTCERPRAHDEHGPTRREYRECVEGLDQRPDYKQLRQRARQEFQAALADIDARPSGFVEEFQTESSAARALFALKLDASSRHEPAAALTGPKAKVLSQVRFSDAALADIFGDSTPEEFRRSLSRVLSLMAARRGETDLEDKTAKARGYVADRGERIDELTELWSEAAWQWLNLDAVAAAELDGERVGNSAQTILIPLDDRESLTLASIAEHKGRVLQKLYPELVERAGEGIFGDLDEYEEYVIGYTLMWMSDPSDIELLTTFLFDEDDAPEDLKVYGRGDAPFIGAGRFDIEQLLRAK